jgi:hypothetical protein
VDLQSVQIGETLATILARVAEVVALVNALDVGGEGPPTGENLAAVRTRLRRLAVSSMAPLQVVLAAVDLSHVAGQVVLVLKEHESNNNGKCGKKYF